MKLKVVQLIGSLNDGGAETLVKDYALLLDDCKFDVEIIAEKNIKDAATTKVLMAAGKKVSFLYSHWNFINKVIYVLGGEIYRKHRLKMYLRKIQPDVLHVHLDYLYLLDGLENELKNTKVFYTCHNLPRLFFTGKRECEFVVAKQLLQSNKLRLIALHDNMAAELNEMFGVKNTAVVKNGVNFTRFSNIDKSKCDIRKELGVPENAFVVGHIGRFAHQKNHEFLIDVFKEVANKNPNTFLLLIGHGQLKDKIEGKIKEYGLEDKVLILSHRTDVPYLLNAMDVFVFPSLYEGLGIVLVEAQVAKLRCVVSDRVPSDAILTSSTIPVSLECSAKEWSDIILNNKIINDTYGDLEEYNMEIQIKRLEDIYLN